MNEGFFHTEIFQWVVLPLLIFVGRLTDMSMDTIRIMLLSRGQKVLAPIIGFFQVLIWLLAIQQIFLNLTNVFCYLAYAAGFSGGTFLGMIIEEKIAIGYQVLRIITRKEASELVAFLREQGYGVTVVDGQGINGKVNLIYTIVKRSEIRRVIDIVKQFNPKAFYTVEDVKSVNEGIFK
ncbi:MAG TPA: DUF2179 domain-containing protein [Candidatus Omnitrophota bacterium]|nr:DUF2179 domain-containing protein [Candidatus Omnitrophota bacterium]HSA30463.1 DUF2179 domain-containing protein [Candidatus Omnitrophota bacterium]